MFVCYRGSEVVCLCVIEVQMIHTIPLTTLSMALSKWLPW